MLQCPRLTQISFAVYRVQPPTSCIPLVSDYRLHWSSTLSLTVTKEFTSYYRAAEALNVVGLICLVFLLVSFIFLPAEKTRRHYLSYCLIIAAILLAVSVSFLLVTLRLTDHTIAGLRGPVWRETSSVLR